jgi:hypothetical protein
MTSGRNPRCVRRGRPTTRGFVLASCAAAVLFVLSPSGRAAEVACAGVACGELSFDVKAGCLEIRNIEKSLIVVTFAVGTGAGAQHGLVVLRPYGKDRAALSDRCVGGKPDDLAALAVETRYSDPVEARPTANCEGEACYDVALSNEDGCLAIRNLGNGYIAFDGVGGRARETLLDPHASGRVNAANGSGCVDALVSAAGAVKASFRRTPWALDEALIARCTGDACAQLSRRKVEGCVMFTNNAAQWVKFKMSFVPGNATGITSALYEVAPGKEVMPLPGNMCLRTLAETPYEAHLGETPAGAAAEPR